MTGLRHFQQLSDADRERLFLHPPELFGRRTTPREQLAVGLGATLYVPATRPDLAASIRRRYQGGVVSMVIDLEDSVADTDAHAAVALAVDALCELAAAPDPLPLLFVRPRSVEATGQLLDDLGDGVTALTGVVLPKFRPDAGEEALAAIAERTADSSTPLYAMPVLETAAIAYRETRDAELLGIDEVLNRHRERVLAVRIGATDMSSLFGIRRNRDLTIYEVRVVADAIAAIVNHLARRDGTGFTVTGPVWEYFADHERMFRPLLHETPFRRSQAKRVRERLLRHDLDGLLREAALDRANGLQGKTVIHPSHVPAIHALYAVTHEEYEDALDIANSNGGGVSASSYKNKMNEMKPHRNWSEQTLMRAELFGVTRPDISFVDVLTAQVGGAR